MIITLLVNDHETVRGGNRNHFIVDHSDATDETKTFQFYDMLTEKASAVNVYTTCSGTPYLAINKC